MGESHSKCESLFGAQGFGQNGSLAETAAPPLAGVPLSSRIILRDILLSFFEATS